VPYACAHKDHHSYCIALTYSSESYKRRSSLLSVVKVYTTAVARIIISIQLLHSEVMKFQLVATVLLVGCMFGPSLAAPLREDEKANVVLQAIRYMVWPFNAKEQELFHVC